MLKLGKLTDYAIAVMGQLSREEPGVAHSAQALAGKTGMPAPTVAKVLKRLSKGGLVVSVRGFAGGYKLAKPAEQVSVGEIIAAMEGPVSIVSCVDGDKESCGMWGTCPTKDNWGRVNEAIRSTLDGIKLAEMLSPPRARVQFIGNKNVNRA